MGSERAHHAASRERRLTLPSSGCPTGCAGRPPLMSNVSRHQSFMATQAYLANVAGCASGCGSGLHGALRQAQCASRRRAAPRSRVIGRCVPQRTGVTQPCGQALGTRTVAGCQLQPHQSGRMHLHARRLARTSLRFLAPAGAACPAPRHPAHFRCLLTHRSSRMRSSQSFALARTVGALVTAHNGG